MPWLYKQKKSENWWIGYRNNGRQFLRSTGTADREKAEAELAKLNLMALAHKSGTLTQEFYESLTGKSIPRKTLCAEISDWMADCATSTKAGTLSRYQSVMEQFRTHMGATETGPILSQIDTEQVRSYLTERLKKASASTANLERKILRMFFKRAIENGVLKSNPAVAVKPFKSAAAKTIRRAFTIEEIERIYGATKDDFWRYMILGGLYTGLRLGDLICLDWSAVDWKDGVLRVIPMKTGGTSGKTVQVPIHPTFRLTLEKLWTTAGKPKRGFLWAKRAEVYGARGANSFSNEFYEVLTEAGGLVTPREDKRAHKKGREAKRDTSKVSFHSLRHSFVTFLKITGANSSIARELAGHSSESMNLLYTHLPLETLSKAVAQLPEVAR